MRRTQSVFRGWHMPVLTLVLLLGSGRSFCQDLVQQARQVFLDKAARQASAFLKQFSEVKCTEQVTQEKLTPGGKVEFQEGSTFDYLMILSNAGGDLSFNESRLAQKSDRNPKNLPMLVTNGFGTLLLIFHPYYQRGFEFSDMGDDVVAGKRLRRIHFQHIHGLRSPAGLLLRGREYPLDLEGTAWLDPDTGTVVRMSARFDRGLQDLGLRMLRSEVDYAPVSFPGVRDAEWLPAMATVEVETQRQHWLNVHHFTSYQRFDVNTQESVTLPK
jgi:hypothetical protein